MTGRILDGRFRVDALLGEGGLGQVYRGTHLRLGRPVAIKVMHAHHVTKDELRTRFDREAKSLAALTHPNVVGVIDYGLDGDVPFLVMELLEGRTLEAAIHDGLPTDRIVPIFRDVLRAVSYAHGLGLVHRDLKPANVFLQRVPEIGEVVRVLDFGLAKFVDGEGAHATVTRAGMVIGTPAYMSPEQATASVVDARADVYSLGVLLFEMITGQRPFTGDDGAEVLRKHLLQAFPKMRSLVPDSPLVPLLEPIVLRATEKSKADRYDDASQMAAALDAAVGRASTPAMPGPPRRPSIDKTAQASIHVTISDVPVSSPNVATGPRRSMASSSSSTRALGIGVVLGVVSLLGLAFVFGAMTGAPASTGVATPPPTSAAPPTTVALALPPTTVALPTTVAFVPPPVTEVAPLPVTEVAPPVTEVAPPPPSFALVPPTSAVIPPTTVVVVVPNPWATPLPPQLLPIATRIDEEREISGDQRALLNRFSRNHPHDARGWLLLGHAEVIAHALTDACHRYQHAYDIDHDARFDPRMRHDLVMLASHGTTSTEASRMVRAIYGLEALPEIATVQGQLGRDTYAINRLTRLRDSISPPP